MQAFVLFALFTLISGAPITSNKSKGLQLNGEIAQKLNSQFADIKKDDPCTDGLAGCVESRLAICEKGKWVLDAACSVNGTTCLFLPSLRTPGTIRSCSSIPDALKFFEETGVKGGVDGNGLGAPKESETPSNEEAEETCEGDECGDDEFCEDDEPTTTTTATTTTITPGRTITITTTVTPVQTASPSAPALAGQTSASSSPSVITLTSKGTQAATATAASGYVYRRQAIILSPPAPRPPATTTTDFLPIILPTGSNPIVTVPAIPAIPPVITNGPSSASTTNGIATPTIVIGTNGIVTVTVVSTATVTETAPCNASPSVVVPILPGIPTGPSIVNPINPVVTSAPAAPIATEFVTVTAAIPTSPSQVAPLIPIITSSTLSSRPPVITLI